MSYTALKEATLKQFNASDVHHISALEDVKCTGSVHKFNTDFMVKSAAALPIMGEYAVKQ